MKRVAIALAIYVIVAIMMIVATLNVAAHFDSMPMGASAVGFIWFSLTGISWGAMMLWIIGAPMAFYIRGGGA